jgi:hypothetical protein
MPGGLADGATLKPYKANASSWAQCFLTNDNLVNPFAT